MLTAAYANESLKYVRCISTQTNPNHPSVILTHQNILDAFTLQLHKMDFSAITVMNITRKTNINRSTFCAHFQDKVAVLEAFFEKAFFEYGLKKVNKNEPLTEEAIKQLIFSLCDYHESNKKCFKKYDTAATILSLSIYEITYEWNLGGRQESPADLAERILPLLMNGVVPLKD